MTLYTRGKKAITSQIADDTDWGYKNFASSIKHIAGDRQVRFIQHSVYGAGISILIGFGHQPNR